MARVLACTFAAFASAGAHADVLLDEAQLIGLPDVASPSEYSFTASDAQALTVTLTDFQTPAAFGSLQIAVTLGDTLVGTGTVDASHAATVAVPAAAGNYVLHVIGTPDATQGIGSFGVCVTRNADPAPRSCVSAYSFSGNIQTPATASTTGTSTLTTNFTATTSGTYTVALTDDAFPVALQSVSALIFNGSAQVGGVIPAGATGTQVTLTGGTTYTLLVAAIADAGVQAGLYGLRIKDPSGTAVFDRTLPVGKMGASTVLTVGATPFTATLIDAHYPATLASVGTAITAGGLPALTELLAPGSASAATSPTGSVEVWTYATATASPGVYSLNIANASSSLLSTTEVVNPGGGSATSFAFLATLPSAGSYNLSVADFQFPSKLQSLNSTIAQNGTVLAADSSGNFTAAAGMAVVLVNAQPPQSGNGIFAVTVKTTGSTPQIVLDQTQPVGGVFTTRTVNVGTTGGYDLTLTDLGFPANFQNLSLVLSQGSQVLGKIYGGGTFTVNVTPGAYVLTFVATPGTQDYGLYAADIQSSAPTVTLTAGATSVTSGQAVQLTWTSQNAVNCSATGPTGWSGTQAVSGTAAVTLTATTTLSLSCTGPGGTTSQSVSVATTPASKSGGGALTAFWLALLAGLVGARAMRTRSETDPVAGLS
jgi:hypothetical protein